MCVGIGQKPGEKKRGEEEAKGETKADVGRQKGREVCETHTHTERERDRERGEEKRTGKQREEGTKERQGQIKTERGDRGELRKTKY